MSLKKSSVIVITLILIISLIMNIYQFTSSQNSKSRANGNVELFVKEMNNIKVSISKFSLANGVIEVVVDADGLDKDKWYSISLGSDNSSSGVTLSEGNTLIRVGELVNETQFIPLNSRLNFWTTHPERVLNDHNLYIRIVDHFNNEIFKMEMFKD